MTEVMIWNPVELVFWGIALATLFIGAFICFYRGREKENYNEKIITYGVGGYFLGHLFYVIFIIVNYLYIDGAYRNVTFYGDIDKLNQNNVLFIKICIISFAIGYLLFLLSLEIILKFTKYILSIILSILIILIIITPNYSTFFNIAMIAFMISNLSFIIILLYITKWSRFEFKAISSILIFGGALSAMGIILTRPDVKRINIIPLFIAPLCSILGALIILLPMIVNPESFLRAIIYWIICGILTIGLSVLILFYYIIGGMPVQHVINNIIITGVLVFILYDSLKAIRTQTSKGLPESKEELLNILGTFSKPPKITEEEVMFHKEQKICLVCKGKLLRSIYLCPSCDALYCKKCSDALSDLENACWVCNAPFDESKPSKPYEREEEELEMVEEDISKKGKANKNIKI